jgi:hypothetical protein
MFPPFYKYLRVKKKIFSEKRKRRRRREIFLNIASALCHVLVALRVLVVHWRCVLVAWCSLWDCVHWLWCGFLRFYFDVRNGATKLNETALSQASLAD